MTTAAPKRTGERQTQTTENLTNEVTHARGRIVRSSGTQPSQLLCLINPWSVVNKAPIIYDFIIDNDVDLLAVTETWLTGTVCDGPVLSALVPKGYQILQAPRKSRGGGIAVIYRENVKMKRAPTTSYETFEVLECQLHDSVDIRLSIVYRPPGNRNGNTANSFMDEFSDYLSALVSAPGHPLVLGDFNFHIDDSQDRTAASFCDVTSSFGLHQHIRGPTHKNGHTLDLVFSRESDKIISSTDVLDCGFPDHFVVFATLAVKKPPLPKKTIKYRKIKSVSEDALKESVMRSQLSDASRYDTLTLEEIITLYNTELGSILDELAPEKQCTLTIRPLAKWYNEAIRSAKQERRQKERHWRKTGLVIHRDIFIEERKKVNALITKTKKQYYKDTILSFRDDSKQLFKMTSELLGSDAPPPLLSSESHTEKANRFSDFFVQKIERIHDSITIDDDQVLPEMNFNDTTEHMCNFRSVEMDELMPMINRCAKKTCDLDPMPSQMIRAAVQELAPIMLHILNTSLTTGVFPDNLKHAIVIPRLKKSSLDPDNCANFRPVSNLPMLAKLLERGAAEQLSDHLTNHNLLEPQQSAYRPRHSTETAIVRVHNDICRAIGENKVVLLVLLDLSAAFDTVSHVLLLETLHRLGIRDTAFEWFKSYLDKRDQFVRVQTTDSDSKPLSWGVPQGSVLGPILFNIYSSSLGCLLRERKVGYHLYADDSQIYITVNPDQIDAAAASMEECIRLVSAWMSQHHLKMNNNKTEFLILSKKLISRQIRPPSLNVCGHSVQPTDSARNIGVIMDSHLSMDAHVASICRAAYFQLHRIAQIKQFLDRASLECIIHAFITTRLDYCNAILCGAKKDTIKKMQRIQNAAARLLTNTKKRDHITPVLRSLHWLPVEMRIKFKVCVMVFKCLHGLAPAYLRELIRPLQNNRRTAAQLMLYVPFTNSEKIKNCAFSFAGPILYNELPIFIKEAKSINVFKAKLKTHLFTKYFA